MTADPLREGQAGLPPGVPATLFWPAAVVRALSPARLLAVLLGLLLTQALLVIPFAVRGRPFQLFQPPWELIRALVAGGSRPVVFWGLVLGTFIGAAWGLVGGWIAWLEFRAQKAPEEALSVTLFLPRKAAILCMPVVTMLAFVAVLVVLGWVAGGINTMFPWGIGAVLLAVVLPLLLMLGFLVVVCVIGCLALPLMPAATAAEGSDSFDALSRGFTYLFQRPLEYACWGGLALVLAALPLAGVLSLVQGEQPLLNEDARPVLSWLGLLVSLSLFWSLIPLVYVKMRWLIDDVPETELWTGLDSEVRDQKSEVRTQKSEVSEEERDTGGTLTSDLRPLTSGEEPAEPVAAKLVPAHEQFTFGNTLTLGNAGGPSKLVGLLPGMVWTALVLAGGLWVASRLVAEEVEWTPAGLYALVLEMAQRRPLALTLLFCTVVVVAAVGMSRPLRMITRVIAVRAVYEQEWSLGQALPFARRSGSQGLFSVWLLTAAAVLYLAGLPLAFLAAEESERWLDLACLWGAAVLLGGAGSLGLGAVAVDGRRLEEKTTSPLGDYLANGGELLVSALLSLVTGGLLSAILFGMAALTWFFVRESLGWVGGRTDWVSWGLPGQLAPEVKGPLYWFASRLAGLWFFLLFGLVLMYPLAYLLRWGVVCYLRARQQAEQAPAEPLDLNDEERSDLLEGLKKRKKAAK